MTTVAEQIEASAALTRDDHLLLVEAVDQLLSLAATAACVTYQPTYSPQAKADLCAVRAKLRRGLTEDAA